MRVQLAQVQVEIQGVRREEHPRRYVEVHYRYQVSGDGLDQEKAERAVTLSLEKYCSVLHSLAPDIKVTHEVVLA
jgi:putative redox protein